CVRPAASRSGRTAAGPRGRTGSGRSGMSIGTDTSTPSETASAAQETQQTSPAAESVTMTKALNRALRDSLADDENVLVFGEDVGRLGGVFRVTEGLRAEFGSNRVWDSPLAESGIAGTAIGMAMGGMRPVIEMQFDAFAYPAFEQIASHLAKMRNRTRGALAMSIVVRIPYAGGIGGVEHHRDSSEAYYAHTPGLKVITPATVADAYLLLRAAIDSPDPVVFMEPKKLYFSKDTVDLDALRAQYERAAAGEGADGSGEADGAADEGRRALISGGARIARPGTDATLVAYGPSVPTVLAAAEAAAEEGRSPEVIDARPIVPFDDQAGVAS